MGLENLRDGGAPLVQSEADRIASATVWVSGRKPAVTDAGVDHPAGVLRWFDVSPSASVDSLFDLLESRCDGLAPDMLQDLLVLDDLPQGGSWNGGATRLASTFGIYPKDALEGVDWTHGAPPSASAVYQAVELLAGDDWLITKWHDPCLYCGSELVRPLSEPVGRAQLVEAVSRRWAAGTCRCAGDLGVMVMYELALTYVPAYRSFRTALEEWEMGLYGFSEGDSPTPDPEEELRDLWGARARFRDWLGPLNVIGLRGDLDKAWLPAEDHGAVKGVDERVDKALDGLHGLGDTLRSSFQLLHIQKAEAQREHRERVQRRVEIIATVFLVPTLVVGFFGANTWVPGEHRHSGLEGMVAVMIVLTLFVMVVLWGTQRRHDAKQVAWHRRGT